jgi:DNA polymerase-3 subunit beta
VQYSGPNLDIAFNPLFVIDILKNVDEEHVLFELTNSLNPALVTPVNDKNYLCVVMPMRL